MSRSTGKDSAWALHVLQQQGHFDVRGIFTTVTETVGRVAVHETPAWVLAEQADRLALPLYEIPIPNPCSNERYEAAMRQFLDTVRSLPPDQGASCLAFGDLTPRRNPAVSGRPARWYRIRSDVPGLGRGDCQPGQRDDLFRPRNYSRLCWCRGVCWCRAIVLFERGDSGAGERNLNGDERCRLRSVPSSPRRVLCRRLP